MSKALYSFIKKAQRATYAGGKPHVKSPERKGFNELVFKEGILEYRDSYVGFFRSRGMEVIRKNNVPIWSSSYGGGMINEKEKIANETFSFLKKALSQKEGGIVSFRGPQNFVDDNWRYNYHQDGTLQEFMGYERIFYNDKLIFFHRIIGGSIVGK